MLFRVARDGCLLLGMTEGSLDFDSDSDQVPSVTSMSD